MSLTPKAKLKARLAELTASIDALPDDVLSNDLERDKVQGQISKLQAAVETPMETVTSMMFQVCLHILQKVFEAVRLTLIPSAATQDRCGHNCS